MDKDGNLIYIYIYTSVGFDVYIYISHFFSQWSCSVDSNIVDL